MQPDTIVVTAGTSFAISGRSGDVEANSPQGFYAADTRFLSHFRVSIEGRLPLAVGSSQTNHSIASFYVVNRGRRGLPGSAISMVRDRYVAEGMHEDISLINHSTVTRTVHLELTVDVDFADIFEVRGGRGLRRPEHVILEEHSDYAFCFTYRRDGFERCTLIQLTGEPSISGRSAVFEVVLQPQEQWKTCITVFPVISEVHAATPCVESVIGPPFGPYQLAERRLLPAPPQTRQPLEDVPELFAEDPNLAACYEAAVAGLRSLRMEYLEGTPILAAGLPWFMAVFGRDSMISAIQTKLLGQELMVGTLQTMASLQATQIDEFRDSEPGKMPHEIRMGELSVIEQVPHSRYYGTIDATPLFLRLLLETYEWTGNLELVRALMPAAKAAITWIDEYGDVDGDGFLEYRRRTRHGLRNQGWKDSEDSISFADGTLAEVPIALAEVQGYAYEAKRSMAMLLRLVGEAEDASRLDDQAERLRQTFDEAFWMPQEGFYALALDARKRQVNAIASNAGHLLWSGIALPGRAAAVVQRLMSPDMFSGWGVRTLSTEMALYNPVSYHNGSIWPHDNSLIAAGMARYGFRREAAVIASAILDAAGHFADHRVPELFAGYPRRAQSAPVPYPAANAPQAWSCGAVIYLLETLLGAQVSDGKLDTQPHTGSLGSVHLERVPYRGMRIEL